MVPLIETHNEFQARTFCMFAQQLCFIQRQCERFFHKHVFARIQRGMCERRMGRGRRKNRYKVNLAQCKQWLRLFHYLWDLKLTGDELPAL